MATCETKRALDESIAYESNKAASEGRVARIAANSSVKLTKHAFRLLAGTESRVETSFISLTARRKGFSEAAPKAPCVQRARKRLTHSLASGDVTAYECLTTDLCVVARDPRLVFSREDANRNPKNAPPRPSPEVRVDASVDAFADPS